MRKYAAAALVAALALTGCASANAASVSIAKASPAPTHSNIYEAVWQNWDGTDRPDERWIDTAAMLTCKQIIGGIDPRVVRDHAHNNEVVVAAAEAHVCEIDR
ncbi:hypothetical protein [Agrococcus sp. DT81.2]|uniref:hypothetical protein n=1 Tax=Agrococcus sp. DT81.2 TaxID=3393414 RepID=UPI003CE518E5